MDPRDPQRALPDGTTCTVCDEPVPADRIRLLACRDDLTFVHVECAGCGSTSLEFVVSGPEDQPAAAPAATTAFDGHPAASPPPISYADVRAMREFLDSYRGDARRLVERLHGSGRSSRGVWSIDRGRRR